MIRAQEQGSLKIGEDMSIYMVYMKKDKKSQILSVTSDDVVVYVSMKSACMRPRFDCHDLSGTKTKPIRLFSKYANPGALYIGFHSTKSTVFQYSIEDFYHKDTELSIGE
jgi:hypothetical protein